MNIICYMLLILLSKSDKWAIFKLEMNIICHMLHILLSKKTTNDRFSNGKSPSKAKCYRAQHIQKTFGRYTFPLPKMVIFFKIAPMRPLLSSYLVKATKSRFYQGTFGWYSLKNILQRNILQRNHLQRNSIRNRSLIEKSIRFLY